MNDQLLGTQLVRDEIISREQLHAAMRLQRDNNSLLGSCLNELGFASEQQVLDAVSTQLSIPILPHAALSQVCPDAVEVIPVEEAQKLRLLPFSFDGEILTVVIADGRTLAYLKPLSLAVGAAIAAYVVSEKSLREAFKNAYGVPLPISRTLSGRTRPVALSSDPTASSNIEVPSIDFSTALGLGEEETTGATHTTQTTDIGASPVLLHKPVIPHPIPLDLAPAPIATAMVTKSPINLSGAGFYDSIEGLYGSTTMLKLLTHLGAALLNYFSRVMIMQPRSDTIEVTAVAGIALDRNRLSCVALPIVTATPAGPHSYYGVSSGDPRIEELSDTLGFTATHAAQSVLLVSIPNTSNDESKVASLPPYFRLLIYADRVIEGAAQDPLEQPFEDLHDIEMLLKETTAAIKLNGL